MYYTGFSKKVLNYVAGLLLLSSCATSYIRHPFPEQPLNDKGYTDDRKDYAGSIDVKRERNHMPFAKTKVYYNNRLAGRAGTRDALTIYFDPGIYQLETRGWQPHKDTFNFTGAEIVNIGHGNFIDPVMIIYKARKKIFITRIDTVALKSQ